MLFLYSYFLYNDESNIYKKILKDNFDGNKIYKDYRTIEEVFYKKGGSIFSFAPLEHKRDQCLFFCCSNEALPRYQFGSYNLFKLLFLYSII